MVKALIFSKSRAEIFWDKLHLERILTWKSGSQIRRRLQGSLKYMLFVRICNMSLFVIFFNKFKHCSDLIQLGKNFFLIVISTYLIIIFYNYNKVKITLRENAWKNFSDFQCFSTLLVWTSEGCTSAGLDLRVSEENSGLMKFKSRSIFFLNIKKYLTM